MKFAIGYKELAETLTTVGKAVAVKGVNLALSNFHITAENNRVRFVGTDNEIMMISYVDAEIETEGVFTVPAKLLQEFIASLSTDNTSTVVFELTNPESGLMSIKSGATNFKIQIQGTENYPPLPVIDNSTGVVINHERLLKGMKEAQIAIGVDEGSPILKSICFDFANAECPTLAATDSKRLSVSSLKDFELSENLRKIFIIPLRAIPELMRLLENRNEIKLSLHGTQLLFSTEKDQFITRVLDGRFPEYAKIIPKGSNRTIRFKREELTRAFKPIAQVAKNILGHVVLDIQESETRIWSDAREMGMCEHHVSCVLEGEPISMAFNVKFLQDFLGVIDDEELILELTTPNYPGLMKPVNSESDYKYVIMPMPMKAG